MTPEKLLAAISCNLEAHDARIKEIVKLRSINSKKLSEQKSDTIQTVGGIRDRVILEEMIESYNQELRDIFGL